jgi:hypothetical protein
VAGTGAGRKPLIDFYLAASTACAISCPSNEQIHLNGNRQASCFGWSSAPASGKLAGFVFRWDGTLSDPHSGHPSGDSLVPPISGNRCQCRHRLFVELAARQVYTLGRAA